MKNFKLTVGIKVFMLSLLFFLVFIGYALYINNSFSATKTETGETLRTLSQKAKQQSDSLENLKKVEKEIILLSKIKITLDELDKAQKNYATQHNGRYWLDFNNVMSELSKQFKNKFEEIEHDGKILNLVLGGLKDKFIYGELMRNITEILKNNNLSEFDRAEVDRINWLATSHYETTFSLDTAISERVIFPVSYSETNGIEDARFVKFIDDDGSITYYATYTAYNGHTILSTLLETKDFYHFKIKPLYGAYAIEKGMALFPRKINGKYAMLSRFDGYSNYIMFSDNINIWQEAKKIQEPLYPWEFVKLGNAGSPLETEKGWLLITHSVGPMRRYSLGAILLDLDNPSKVIARLKEPLLMPNKEERDGYVPNIVYSCGSIILNNELIIPYAMSDSASTFATISLDELFNEMVFK